MFNSWFQGTRELKDFLKFLKKEVGHSLNPTGVKEELWQMFTHRPKLTTVDKTTIFLWLKTQMWSNRRVLVLQTQLELEPESVN